MTKEALHKIEEFVKVALDEITSLKQQVGAYHVKEASVKARQNKELEQALKKAADAMYSSDFINDEDEKALFVKKASEDPMYLAKIVERVCNASDVAYMGKSSAVKSAGESDDPVIRKAFGYSGTYSLLDE
jgi:hypothetical protein